MAARRRGPATRQERASGTVGGDHDELRVFGRLVVHGRQRAGLDYRLTYTHPVTKKRIVICPQAVRDELRARAAH